MNGRYNYMKIGLSICIVCGILLCIAFLGLNSMWTSESEAIVIQEEEKEEVPVSSEIQAETDKAENKSLSNEIVSASGMVLRDDTALLVTVMMYAPYSSVYEEYEYDKEGCLLRYIKRFFDSGRWEYEYDDAGNLTRETCYETEGDEVRYWIEYRDVSDDTKDEVCRIGSRYEGEGNLYYEIIYDSEGNRVKLTYYDEDKTAYRVIEYEDENRETRLIDYDKQGNIVGRREFEYDASGNMILMVDYDEDGNIKVSESYDCDTYRIIHHYWVTENEYDAAGNLIKRVDYDYEGNIEDVFEYTYDETGNLLQYMHNAVEYNANGVIEYEYDSEGNMTKEITVPDNQWKEYEYDSENRIIKLTEYLHGEVKHGYRYEYITIKR